MWVCTKDVTRKICLGSWISSTEGYEERKIIMHKKLNVTRSMGLDSRIHTRKFPLMKLHQTWETDTTSQEWRAVRQSPFQLNIEIHHFQRCHCVLINNNSSYNYYYYTTTHPKQPRKLIKTHFVGFLIIYITYYFLAGTYNSLRIYTATTWQALLSSVQYVFSIPFLWALNCVPGHMFLSDKMENHSTSAGHAAGWQCDRWAPLPHQDGE